MRPIDILVGSLSSSQVAERRAHAPQAISFISGEIDLCLTAELRFRQLLYQAARLCHKSFFNAGKPSP